MRLLMHDKLLMWVLPLPNLCRFDLYLLHLGIERQLLLPFVHPFDVLVEVELSRRLENDGVTNEKLEIKQEIKAYRDMSVSEP